MDDFMEKKEEMDFASILENFEERQKDVHSGEIVKGKIIGFNDNEVFVDISSKSDGVIPMLEFQDDLELQRNLVIGQELDVFVSRVNEIEGMVNLSVKKVQTQKAWESMEKIFRDGTVLQAKINNVVKGGLIAIWKGLKVFIPGSQISNEFVKNLEDYLGEIVQVRIIDFNPHKRRLVGSRRVVLEEERQTRSNEIWHGLSEERQYRGVVKNLTKFGAFVDIGGVDGLIHVSDLSWGKISQPSDVLTMGQQVEVMVKSFDREKKKISLYYLGKGENPWSNIEDRLQENQELPVKVLKLVPFGAFVEILPGIEGLLHISEMSDRRIAKPSEVLKEGQIVQAKILEIHKENQKIALTMKDLQEG